jgi:hypothetical protein
MAKNIFESRHIHLDEKHVVRPLNEGVSNHSIYNVNHRNRNTQQQEINKLREQKRKGH